MKNRFARRTGVGLLVLVSVFASAPSIPIAAADPAAAPSAEERAVLQALDQADDDNTRVRVSALDEETTTTYANPNRTVTVESSLRPVRVRQDDRWVTPDYDLQSAGNDRLEPAASDANVTFSAGNGSDTAAQLKDGSRTLSVTDDEGLTKPNVDGTNADYAVGAGRTLRLTAVPGGFEHSTLLASPPTSTIAPDLTLAVENLTAVANEGGGLDFVADEGSDPTFSMAQPYMFDANDQGGTSQPEPIPFEAKPVDGKIVVTLHPSLAWLQDPARQYPVTIDPVFTAGTEGSDTFIQEDLDTAQGSAVTTRVGSFGGHEAKTLIRWFGLSDLPDGARVTSATMRLWNAQTTSCTARSIKVTPLVEPFTWNGTVWDNAPDALDDDPSFTTSASFASGASGCAAAFQNFNVTPIVDGWYNNLEMDGAPSYGMQLSAGADAGTQGWTFCAMNYSESSPTTCNTASHVPTISVTYDLPPEQVAASAMCVSGTTPACVSPATTTSLQPTLIAKTTDPAAANLRYDFAIYDQDVDTGTNSLVASGSSASTASGATAQWRSSAALQSGRLYAWRVRAYNGALYSPYSDYAMFTVNTDQGAGDAAFGDDSVPAEPGPAAAQTGPSDLDNESSIAQASGTYVRTAVSDYGDGTNTASDDVACNQFDYHSGAADPDFDPGVDATSGDDGTPAYFPAGCRTFMTRTLAAQNRMSGATCAKYAPLNLISGYTQDRYHWCSRGTGFAKSQPSSNGQYARADYRTAAYVTSQRNHRAIDVYLDFGSFRYSGTGPSSLITARHISAELNVSGWPTKRQCHLSGSPKTVAKKIGSWAGGDTAHWVVRSDVTGSSRKPVQGGSNPPPAPSIGTCVISIKLTFVEIGKSSPNSPVTGVRCDSAKYLPRGGGCVLDRVPASFAVSGSSTSPVKEVADHIYTALTNPEATYPKYDGKIIPGNRTSLIHRHRGRVSRSRVQTVCRNVFGTNYTSGGKQCDEFPFASTDESAGVSTGTIAFSARPVNGTQNVREGNNLKAWYLNNRILDLGNYDGYYVRVTGRGTRSTQSTDGGGSCDDGAGAPTDTGAADPDRPCD